MVAALWSRCRGARVLGGLGARAVLWVVGLYGLLWLAAPRLARVYAYWMVAHGRLIWLSGAPSV